MRYKKWNEKNIIQTLQILHSQGEKITPSELHKTNHGLLAAGVRIFGNSRAMYSAAGINPDSLKMPREWTNRQIIEAIQKRYHSGNDMSQAGVRKEDNGLLLAASRRFNGWYNSLEAAGIDSSNYRRLSKQWTRENIIETLKILTLEGMDVRPGALARSHAGLMDAAYRFFANSESMYKEAGINPDEIGMLRKWTKEAVIGELKKMFDHGEDIRPRQLHLNHSGLYKAGQRLFGSSKAMYLAAELDLSKIGFEEKYCHSYTRDNVIHFLKESEQDGEDLRRINLDRKHHGLYMACLKFFGSLWNTYQAAGIDPQKYLFKKHGYWNCEKILNEIRDLNIKGNNLDEIECKRLHSDLYYATRKYFNNWNEACELAIHPSTLPNMSDEQIIKELKILIDKGEHIDPKSLNRNHHVLYWLAVERFGSPTRMYENVGVNPNKFKRKRRTQWNKEKISGAIKALEYNGEDLRATNAARWHSDLYSAALTHYGGWQQACSDAGIPKNKYFTISRRNLYSDEQIIHEIRELSDQGAPLDANSISAEHPILFRHAQKQFSGWFNALEAAGIPSENYRVAAAKGYWNKSKVIDEIKVLESAFHDLSYTGAARLRSDLVTAAAKIFGSWRIAVKEAGFDYGRYVKQHDRYTDDELLDFLRNLHEQGISLDTQSLKRINQCKLNIIWKRFGSYENAIRAIGLDYDKIRRDWLSECYKGKVFERYVLEALNVLDWNVEYQKRFYEELDSNSVTYIPDFFEPETGLWIDAKLSPWNFGVDLTISKYLAKSEEIMIIYLTGKPREWPDNKVKFIHIDSLYEDFIKNDAEYLIRDFEKLKMGIFRPNLQSEIDNFN
jgi:hypothetical protein